MKSIKESILILFFLFIYSTTLNAQTIESSVFTEIPQTLNFGDTLETITKAMGREPDSQVFATGGRTFYVYSIFATSVQENQVVAYGFDSDKLSFILVFLANDITDLKRTNELSNATSIFPLENLEKQMLKQYGKTKKISLQAYLPLPGANYEKPIESNLWELENNAIIATPIMDVYSLDAKIIWFCKLDSSGKYDFLNTPEKMNFE